ncbi:MAG: hypothetical protein JNK05_38910 [Myxococcales bacterium]|nr:hypothetical protein [Myxococcales bacterium]
MRPPAALRLRYRVQPRGLWPEGRVIDSWMNPARTCCFALLDTGWVVSIDASSGRSSCVELLGAERALDRFEYGAFFGEERCRLCVLNKRRECFFFELEPNSPPRLVERASFTEDGVLSMRQSLDQSRMIVHGVNRWWVFLASTFELDDATAYPPELREWSGRLVRGHEREVVLCDASGVRVSSKDRAPWQCVRFDGGGFTEVTRASATALLAVQRSDDGRLRAAWHIDLASRTIHDLRAMGVSQAGRALSCGAMLALSRDRDQIDLVDLDRGTIVATLNVGLHTLVSMDSDCVFVLRHGALARVDLRDRSVTAVGEQTHEETAPITAIFVTDRAELVTVNATGRRCAYDSQGALVAESNEPISSLERVRFIGSADGDTFILEQKTQDSRGTVITKRSLAGRDLLQEVARMVLPRGEVVHGCTSEGRVLSSHYASSAWLSLSNADLSKSERLFGADGTITAFAVRTAEGHTRLQCHAPEMYDGDGNPMGPPPPEFLLYFARGDTSDARGPGPYPPPKEIALVGPFAVYEGALGERFLRVRRELWSRRVYALGLTGDESSGCAVADQDEIVFYSADARRETSVSYAGWFAAGEFVTECRFSTQAKHLALATSLGRVFVATLEEGSIESGADNEE